MAIALEIDYERVLILDDISRMPYELERLRVEFNGLVDATTDVSSVEESLERGQYRVVVVDPFAITKNVSRASALIRKLRTESRGIVLADSGFGPRELGLIQGADFDYVHAKPYNLDGLVGQIRELANRDVLR